jgi:hypothetical protein
MASPSRLTKTGFKRLVNGQDILCDLRGLRARPARIATRSVASTAIRY